MFVQSTNQSFETEGELSWKRPTGLCRRPTSQHSEKNTWEMMVNPDVDGYTKTANQRKILRKTQKDDNLLKNK